MLEKPKKQKTAKLHEEAVTWEELELLTMMAKPLTTWLRKKRNEKHDMIVITNGELRILSGIAGGPVKADDGKAGGPLWRKKRETDKQTLLTDLNEHAKEIDKLLKELFKEMKEGNKE